MVGLVAHRSIDKNFLKKRKEKGVQALFLLVMVESEASPPLFTMVGPIMPINIRKKQEKKGGGEPKLLHYW